MKKILTAVTLGLCFYAADSSAQLFKINIVNESALDPAVTAALRTALDTAEIEINKDFPNASNPKRLMEGMANASVMSGKGVGSDYASRMQVALIGAGVGVGADMEKDKQTDSDLSGIGLQGGLIVGTNLGWLDTEKILGLYTDRLNIYANFFKYNHEKKMGDADKDTIDADLGSFGVHVSYDLVTPSGNNLARWGGIKIHTGVERNTTKLTFKSTINEAISGSYAGGTVSGTVDGSPEAVIDVATTSIPLEISTNVQLLYVLSLYGGLGVDFNFGSAKGDAALNAKESPLTCSAGGVTIPCGTGEDPVVQAEADINGKGMVASFTSRAFAGVQINLPYVNIFVQADKALGSELVAGTAGVRLVY